jgi:hypothetical protein
MAEYLVVLRPQQRDAALQALGKSFRVAHVSSGHVAVVAAPPGAGPPDVDGVEHVYRDRVPPEILESLGQADALFARAWERRQHEAERERPGAGLPWDAGGFEPPDLPNEDG